MLPPGGREQNLPAVDGRRSGHASQASSVHGLIAPLKSAFKTVDGMHRSTDVTYENQAARANRSSELGDGAPDISD
jgi:hypothetical protein